jgi:hypothetical protein
MRKLTQNELKAYLYSTLSETQSMSFIEEWRWLCAHFGLSDSDDVVIV